MPSTLVAMASNHPSGLHPSSIGLQPIAMASTLVAMTSSLVLTFALWNLGYFFDSVKGLVWSSSSNTILGAKSRFQYRPIEFPAQGSKQTAVAKCIVQNKACNASQLQGFDGTL